ncbi:hypothetical protein [Agriterribacter sp.]|uniref:hypothetical protein n=1 Tax=Agriterribacter sp. TaxID=2821509 RepID=UPI002C2BD474|nr:hypothetical protein [Agriterribacter sp.]HTN06173.1 hypothetical protein [Agriterribacter sp.]
MEQKKISSRRKFLQNSALTAAGFTMAPSITIAQQEYNDSEKETSDDFSERTLFAFDDHSIPWQHNLKVTLVEATKYPGNPVLKSGLKGAPDEGHAILYGTVIKDGNKFRMWYLGMFENEILNGQAPGYWRPMCYAESIDGINWIKPELGLVTFNGNKRNNICQIEGTPESWTRVNDFLSVLYEPNDPNPLQRYKSVYIAHVPYKDVYGGSKTNRVICAISAISADGLSWKVVGDRAVHAEGEPFEVTSIYRFGDFYYSTGQIFAPWSWLPEKRDVTRVMIAYRSPDFLTWSKAKAYAFIRPGQLTNPPVKGQQVHMGAGLWNRNNVLIGLYGMWDDGNEPPERRTGEAHLRGTHVDLGLIVSNDGIHFREPVSDFKIIERGKEGEWDNVALLQGHAFVNEGEYTMIWYSHWDTSGLIKSMDIGLATLRRDGFGYLSRKHEKEDAHFITAAFTAKKKEKLVINVDGLKAEAPLRVELLDNHDKPIEGYSGTNAALITTSGTQLKVSWPRGNYLPVNQKFSVRVTFPDNSNAKVYALYISRK